MENIKAIAIVFLTIVAIRAEAAPQEAKGKGAGATTYQTHCSSCHGPTGGGGIGPALAVPKLARASNIKEVVSIIKRGVPGSAMPGFEHLIADVDEELLAKFVLDLGKASAVVEVKGDAKKGEALYREKGACIQCHSIQGKGGTMGPEHTAVGFRSPAFLREVLMDPNILASKSVGRANGLTIESATYPDFMKVEAKTKSGEVITGARVNEDVFAIIIRDINGKVHSLWKEDLSEFKKYPGQSLMPSYKNAFSEQEINDLIAYMLTLRSESRQTSQHPWAGDR